MLRGPVPLAVIAAFVIASCNLGGSEETPTAAVQDSQPTTQPATQPPQVVPTVTPQRSASCPDVVEGVEVPPMDDVLNYGNSLVAFLSMGGSIQELAAHAEEFGLLGTTIEGGGFFTPDLDGDGRPEMAISLVNWTEPMMPGRVYVARCDGGEYRVEYATADNGFMQTTKLEDAFDLTGDGLDDLLIVRSSCGAHTCFDWVEVVAWYDDGLSNRMDDSFFDLPSTSIELVENLGDGTYKIVIGGHAVGSVGAGPYHPRSVIWIWDPDANLFRAGELEFQPSNWRVHLIHEGDRNFEAGNYALASENYNRAIHDDTLDDWPSAEWNREYAEQRPMELAAYGRFRQMLTSIKLENPRSAQRQHNELIVTIPQASTERALL